MTTKTHNPADKVERWPITKLVPYARNARTHSDEQVGQIAASIKEWGWTTPILVDETGSIIAGLGISPDWLVLCLTNNADIPKQQ